MSSKAFQILTALYNRYRNAGAEVIKSISKFTSQIERASIDEAYIDATGKKSL